MASLRLISGFIINNDFISAFVSLGIKAGYTLDRVPTHHRAHTHSHSLTKSHTMDNLEMPINLQCMSLDRGRKPEYPEETRGTGRTCKLHTHTVEAGIKPPTLEV
ncbi:hypothetical protein QTP86_034083 [Hemibagrus guttatus]|nr:hypothetical protein QTP86_034083 [Hemibagrus guttatus]